MTALDEIHARRASEPRHEVETVWGARIPGRDGVELSANLWLPRPVAVPGPGPGPGRESRPAERFPAILDADVVYRWREHAFETEIRARSTQTSDAVAFHLSIGLEVDVDGEPFFRRAWNESIERRLV